MASCVLSGAAVETVTCLTLDACIEANPDNRLGRIDAIPPRRGDARLALGPSPLLVCTSVGVAPPGRAHPAADLDRAEARVIVPGAEVIPPRPAEDGCDMGVRQ